MCGIFGYIGKKRDIKPSKIKKSLNHRGPDDFGYFEKTFDGKQIFLSHNRLSIIGLGKQGRQPFVSKDKSIILSFNGEIYNYQKLKKELRKNFGVHFDTQTDTEVLLKGYENWVLQELLEKINGIFAFAIIDLNQKRVFLVRDHLGVKPIYFYRDRDSFYFSSEIKAILSFSDVPRKLNKEVLGEYLANLWIYEPETLFEEIYKLQAGHYLSYDLEKNEYNLHCYWDILEEDGIGGELDRVLESVIQEQMVSDVPIGIYLSGGIDSSIVTFHATKKERLFALNLRNQTEDRYNEFANVKKIEATLPVELKSFVPSSSMLDIYKKCIYFMDEPVADPAIIPAYLLAQEANKNGIKVMLSGMGGDEIFGGYTRIKVINKLNLFKKLNLLLSGLNFFFPKNRLKTKNEIERLSNFLGNPDLENYFSLTYYFSKNEIFSILKDNSWFEKYRNKINNLTKNRDFVDEAQKYQYLDLKGFLSSHNLIYMDKASMASSVEVRVPLLDYKLAGRFFNLPTKYKLNSGLKSLLKKHLSKHLDKSFVKHKKQGFSFPIDRWLDNELRNELEEMVDSSYFKELFDCKVIKNILRGQFEKKKENSMKIWTFYTLWLWLKEFEVQI